MDDDVPVVGAWSSDAQDNTSSVGDVGNETWVTLSYEPLDDDNDYHEVGPL